MHRVDLVNMQKLHNLAILNKISSCVVGQDSADTRCLTSAFRALFRCGSTAMSGCFAQWKLKWNS